MILIIILLNMTTFIKYEILLFFRCVKFKKTALSCTFIKCAKSDIYTNADVPGDSSHYQELTLTKERNPNSYLNTTIH